MLAGSLAARAGAAPSWMQLRSSTRLGKRGDWGWHLALGRIRYVIRSAVVEPYSSRTKQFGINDLLSVCVQRASHLLRL